MAFGDEVQEAQNNVSGVTGTTATFTAATAGNLLVLGVASNTAQTWGTTPTGWNILAQVTNGSGNMSAIFYWVIAAGGETSAVLAWSNSGSNARWALVEFEGAFDGTPLDVSTENEASISTAVTSMSTGTTGTTAQNDELAVGYFASDASETVETGRAYTNSFAENLWPNGVLGRAGSWFVSKVLSATGTAETTFSTTDTGDEMYAAIATFKKAVAAAGQPTSLRATTIPFMRQWQPGRVGR